MHYEGYKFLNHFLDFLNDRYNFTIDKTHYKISSVIIEIGDNESRMDILIKGEGRCILIENKINNAPDMDDQIDRYYSLLTNWKLEIDAIIYLTLDGIKKAPTPLNVTAQTRLKSIGAFTNNNDDLVNGWLNPCFETAKYDDSKTLIYQYIKLLKHLNAKAMEQQSFEEFYNIANTLEILNTAEDIKYFYERLPLFRLEKVIKKIESYQPFKRSKQYNNHPTWLFEAFVVNNNTLKIGLSCEIDYTMSIHFCNQTLPNNDDGHSLIKGILEKIKLLEDFESFNTNDGYKKIFTLEKYKTLQCLDNSVNVFLEKLFGKLRNINAVL